MTSLYTLNLLAGWIGMLFGVISGAVLGLFFHREGWAGGYASHRRRMMRLGHVAFFGLGFLNLAMGWTLQESHSTGVPGMVASYAMIVGAVTMPLCCFLTAWRKGFRHLFPIPVLAVGFAIICIITLTWMEVSS